MDIRPPKHLRPQARPDNELPRPVTQQNDQASTAEPQSLFSGNEDLPEPKKLGSRKKLLIISLVATITLLLLSVVAAIVGYNMAIQAVDSTNANRQLVKFEPGVTMREIASTLKRNNLIRSETAFRAYVHLNRVDNKLQAGTYRFAPNESVEQIVADLVAGKTSAYNITIAPGLTLADIKSRLIESGFSEQDVDAAFARNYTHPLLSDKPETASLEGYIYPETYQIDDTTTIDGLLARSFDEFERVVEEQGIRSKLQARGLSLFQGVVLASIIQKEASGEADQRQISQVFQKRLQEGIVLGSDVTFQYAAKTFNLPNLPSQQSPYNTRIVKGLPPSAIANFNISALTAVAAPSDGDYLYFVAGDDGTVHFSRTEAEHEENVSKYCTIECQ